MTLRTRMSVAFLLAALIPLGVLAHGVRRELTRTVTAQHERRVNTLVDIVRQDLAHESASLSARLEVIDADLATDDRFRLGAVRGDPSQRRYVLDWAKRAMEIAGLSMLRIYDDSDRVVSSGHFRNEFGRRNARLPARIASAAGGLALVRVKTPTGSFLALVRADSIRVGDRYFTVVGGTAVDQSFFTRLGRQGELDVSLLPAEGTPPPRGAVTLPLAFVSDTAPPASTYLAVVPLGNELEALRRDLDRWTAASVVLAALVGAVLVAWAAAALSRPIATLARAALTIDFHTPEVDAVVARQDEVGTLARRFAAMTRRLRTSALRLREAERRATVGEMARQVNHDMKNGLVPIRNVLRHLSQIERIAPHELVTVFGERRATLDSSVAYLDELATRWARLTPRAERRPVGVNAIVADAVAAARDAYAAPLRLELQAGLPHLFADPLAVRRIVDNLVANAAQSLDGRGGTVTVATEHHDHAVRITIADTGRGMTPDELARALAGFYTTKPGGTGLGLSVVRRLAADHGGEVRIDTVPQRGTTVTVELPIHPVSHSVTLRS
jgi:two-component system nitrogen regulation sensor histidine kinase NtrY